MLSLCNSCALATRVVDALSARFSLPCMDRTRAPGPPRYVSTSRTIGVPPPRSRVSSEVGMSDGRPCAWNFFAIISASLRFRVSGCPAGSRCTRTSKVQGGRVRLALRSTSATWGTSGDGQHLIKDGAEPRFRISRSSSKRRAIRVGRSRYGSAFRS